MSAGGIGTAVRALCLAVCAAGCMAQSRVAVVTIRGAGTGLDAPRAVPDRAGESAALGPSSWIRAVGRDGAVTSWQVAGELWVSEAGLVRDPVRLGALETARVTGLDAEATRWLEELKPRDCRAQLTTGFGATEIHVWRADRLIPWMLRFLSRARAAGKPLGTWELTDESALGGIAAEAVAGGPLAIEPGALLAAGDRAGDLRAGHGIPWPEGGELELRYFDAGKSAYALIPLVPIALVVGIVYVALGGRSFHDEGVSEAVGGGPTLVLPSAEAATPLFTAGARRRSFVTLVAAGDAGGTIQGDARGGVTVAARFSELLELGAFARGLSTAAVDGGPGRAERLVVGGRLGVHISTGPVSAWSAVAGADIGAAVTGSRLRVAGFHAGVRRALGGRAFVGLYPLVPTWLTGDPSVSGARFRWIPSLEIGLAL